MQRSTYSGPMCQNTLKVQGITGPNGLEFSLIYPMEAPCHDITLYCGSLIEGDLMGGMIIGSWQVLVYGYLTYCMGLFFMILFSGDKLLPDERNFSSFMLHKSGLQ